MRPVNQPALEKIVKIPVDTRDRVWNWLHEPKIPENTEEWEKMRKPIIIVILEVSNIIFQYGNHTQGEILLEALENILKEENADTSDEDNS